MVSHNLADTFPGAIALPAFWAASTAFYVRPARLWVQPVSVPAYAIPAKIPITLQKIVKTEGGYSNHSLFLLTMHRSNQVRQ